MMPRCWKASRYGLINQKGDELTSMLQICPQADISN